MAQELMLPVPWWFGAKWWKRPICWWKDHKFSMTAYTMISQMCLNLGIEYKPQCLRCKKAFYQ